MNQSQFKSSFILSPLAAQQPLPAMMQGQVNNLTKAAVLVPLVERPNGLFILLSQRAKHLRHHPGQISFPGGRFEPHDGSLIATALRETEEEIGITADQIRILGHLRNYQTVSHYIVTPYVAFISPDYHLSLDKNEVDEAFEVPWSFFLSRSNHHQICIHRDGQDHYVHFMPFKNRFIWGTTAAMIHDLVSHFE